MGHSCQAPRAGAFFDVGGGNGFVARALQNAGVETVLIEPGLTGARNALGRGIRNVIRATLEDAGFLPEVLPAVGLFDVIEHIKEDLEFLAGLHGLLIPNGRIYVTAPALNSLWSQEDNDAGHWRRYTVHSMCKVLEEAGFLGEFATYFFGFLPLPILLLRALPYRLGFVPKEPGHDARDHELNSSLAKRVLRTLTRRELSKIAAARQCICGASCLAVARKC